MLLHAFIYLLAAVLTVPFARRLGLGSVLGYLLAGVLIGPQVLNLVGDRADDVMHFAEFGVVMMLFLVGLELQPPALWRMRVQLFGLGGLQVIGTALAVAAVGLAFHVEFRLGIAAGLILAMSSTAIVLQSLQEKSLLKTSAGEAVFSVLLFQDIAVIPVLAILPLLADGEGPAVARTGVAALPHWEQTLVVIAAVSIVIFAGRHLVNPVFRVLAKTGVRELFNAAALVLIIGVSLIMELVGLSAALGTFVAGVVLANSEYRHEIEADVEPFKGLLLGVFFITVGASIDFSLLRSSPGLIIGLVAGLLVVKFIVLFALSRIFRMTKPDGLLFSFSLAQGGEFAFVLLSFVVEHHVLTSTQSASLVAAVALSMAATPFLFLFNDRVVQPRFTRVRKNEPPPDHIDSGDNPVIIAGFGRFGNVVGRLLRANGVGTTILDLDPNQVDIVRRLGIKVFYGDATRLELLHAAGAGQARAIVIAIDNEVKAVALADSIQRHFPKLKIFARASDRVHAYEFQKRGVTNFYRESVGTALELGVDVLRELGMRAHQAHRAAQFFKRHDERSVRDLAQYWEDRDSYISHAKQHIDAFERMLVSDTSDTRDTRDPAWEPAPSANRPAK